MQKLTMNVNSNAMKYMECTMTYILVYMYISTFRLVVNVTG